MKIHKDTHVLLLKGGFGSEREVSLKSAEACSLAIKDMGLNLTEFDLGKFKIIDIVNINPDVCFNALHGKIGEDGTVQGLLNLLKIPYTHSGVTTSAIAMNKIHFKRVITHATENSDDPIFFPKNLEISYGKYLSVKNYKGPYVIKPINGGSSVGVIIVKDQNKIPLSKNFNYDQMMAEAYVGTKELTVTILKNAPLTVTEIKPKKNNEFYNFDAKYEKNGSFHEIPALIPNDIFEKSKSWALRAHNIIGCKGISRTDFRYDTKKNQLYMLEINTQPGMTIYSLAPEQARFCNVSMKEMVRTLLEEATYEC